MKHNRLARPCLFRPRLGRLRTLGATVTLGALTIGGSIGLAAAEEPTGKVAGLSSPSKSPASSEMQAAPYSAAFLTPDQLAVRFTLLWDEVTAARHQRTTARAHHDDASATANRPSSTVPAQMVSELAAAESRFDTALQAYMSLGAEVRDLRVVERALDSAVVGAPEPLTVLGSSAATATQLAEWFESSYGFSATRIGPVETLAELYVTIGDELGVRGDIAFIQASHETGQFSSGHARSFNLAGIGAFDSCSPGCGVRFPSLDAGVRGHLALMHDYATPDGQQSTLSTPDLAGCCPSWQELARKWATNPRYAEGIFRDYRDLVEQTLRPA